MLPERATRERFVVQVAQEGQEPLDPETRDREQQPAHLLAARVQQQVAQPLLEQPQPALQLAELEYLAASPVSGPAELKFSVPYQWLAVDESANETAT